MEVFTDPPAAHIAHAAANPTPNPAAPSFNHPPYAEMITAAIVGLKEKDGSSRQAIAKYIEQEYTSLPPTHASLLTQQLKRMKNQGQLVMVKHSYMLPRSDVVLNPEISNGPKRRPGRPPKAKPEIQPNATFAAPSVMVSVGPVDGPQGTGLPYYGPPATSLPYYGPPGTSLPYYGPPASNLPYYGPPGTGPLYYGPPGTGPTVDGPQNTFVQVGGPATTSPLFSQPAGTATSVPFDPIGAVPTVVPIEQVDGAQVKRRPGRPPKVKAVAGAEPVGPVKAVFGAEPIGPVKAVVDAEPVGPVGPSSEVGKRRRGRPAKVNNGLVTVGAAGPTLEKRGRGRPKLLSDLMGNGAAPKRGRGRPPRVVGSGIWSRPSGRPKNGAVTVGTAGMPRGRPVKKVAMKVAMNGGAAGGGGVLPAKRAGRHPKMGEEKKPRKLSGKPLGRPKKNSSVAVIKASDQQELIAYQDLKGRVEHFQSRIKQAVSVVKPYLNTETAVIAVGALQELEELSSMDICAPATIQSLPVTVQSAPLTVQSAPLTIQTEPATVQTARVPVQGQEPLIQN